MLKNRTNHAVLPHSPFADVDVRNVPHGPVRSANAAASG
ncbi:hypothetical protein [Alloactinosynnema sp. L-07]|nr:hypothetical protein [Alloactinosynnema sp. L-07]